MSNSTMALPAGTVAALLDQTERQLAEGHPQAALEALRRSPEQSPWLVNAMAVCRLRNGEALTACDALRQLAVSDGMTLRSDVSPVFAANLAAALLASNNLAGYAAVNSQLREHDHPTIREIRTAYSAWKRRLSIGQRLRLALLGEADPPFRFEHPVGALR